MITSGGAVPGPQGARRSSDSDSTLIGSLRARLIGQLSTAVADQVLLSGTSFLVGLLLIRFTSERDYGLYVLVQAALLLLVSVQNAWLVSPLAVIVAKRPQVRREILSSVKMSQRRLLRRAVLPLLAVTAAVFALGLSPSAVGLSPAAVGLAAGCAVIAGWALLRREYLRGVLLIYSRPRDMLAADAVYSGCLLLGVVLATLGGREIVALVMTAVAASAWLGARVAHRSVAADPGWRATADLAPVWRELRPLGFWSLIGTVTYWLFSQSYNYILASRLDLKAVSDVNVTRLMLMPAIVLTIGIFPLLTPSAATWLAQIGLRRLVRRLVAIIAAVGAIDLVYCALVWSLRDWITGGLLHKHIAERDALLIAWALVALIGLARDVLQCALFALERQRNLAWQGAGCAVLALLITWYGVPRWGSIATLVGQIAGELVNLGGILLLIRQGLRRQPE